LLFYYSQFIIVINNILGMSSIKNIDFVNNKFTCNDNTCLLSMNGNTIYELEGTVNQNLNLYYSCLLGNLSSQGSCTSKLNDASNSIMKLKNAVDTLKSSLNSSETITSIPSINTLITTHNQIQNKRNELDLKMKEINHSNDSVYSMYKAKYDSTMYTSIILTILATSLIYYIFIKL